MADPPASIRLFRVIFDERFGHSLAFAAQAERLRVLTRAIRGDVTDVWYNDLDPRWGEGPAAIAGMTTGDSLFCLERLAWDRGMRAVFRAERRCPPAGHIEHAIRGPENLLHRVGDLAEAGANWPGQIAHWFTRFPESRSRTAEATVVTARAHAAADRVPLVSWVIA
ncbi:MAG: hypothetical protein HYY48_01545 [Gammaproteobacteria bacterium]|nr:hypothetical protein [Gammaproteobacteria bacterium]